MYENQRAATVPIAAAAAIPTTKRIKTNTAHKKKKIIKIKTTNRTEQEKKEKCSHIKNRMEAKKYKRNNVIVIS